MKLAIYTVATAGYTYALDAQARKVQGMLFACTEPMAVAVLIVSEGNAEAEACCELYRKLIPGAHVEHLKDSRLVDGHANYQPSAQLVIAQARTIATTAARAWGADFLLSMDSDVLPPANALRCMLDALRFDGGFYGVAACPYPSQGGGAFLGGRGTPFRHILPDAYDEEREIPEEVANERREADEALKLANTEENRERRRKAEKAIEACKPKGNVFELQGKSWRQRGWFDFAYPGIGRGAMVPIDWCGFGMTLMNREAMALCDFTGYGGQGTEDLFIVWRRWYQAGIRIACLPHCPCDHIIRVKQDDCSVKIEHCMTGHETDGEFTGHLRQMRVPWFAQTPGEKPAASASVPSHP